MSCDTDQIQQIAGRLDITVKAENSFSKLFTFKNSDGSAMDFADVTDAIFEVKDSDGVVQFSKDTSDGVTIVDNTVFVEVPMSDTVNLAGGYTHELKLIFTPSTFGLTYVEGIFAVYSTLT